MRITFYDVGQGLSALVVLPDGRRILVDTGEHASRGGCEPACRVWSDHLRGALAKDLPDKRLDAIWITHQHSDHMGNAVDLLGDLTVALYVDNGTGLGTEPRRRTQVDRAHEAARARRVRVVTVDPANPEVPLASTADVKLRAVLPKGDWGARCTDDPNDCSIALRVDYCRSSVLFMGDAERGEESRIEVEPAGVLQVGHHGSDTSTTDAFVSRVRPAWAVISAAKRGEGTNATYCHPRRSVVERLSRATGGERTRPMEVFEGTSCRKAGATDWTTIAVDDHVLLTARDGDVRLVTTGDGTFTRE